MKMLNKIHSTHLGQESLKKRAQDTLYWTGMNNEIKQQA